MFTDLPTNEAMNTLTLHRVRYVKGRRELGQWTGDTPRHMAQRIDSFVQHFGRRPLSQLTCRAIEAWMGDIAHLAPASRAAYLSAVRGFTAWMVAEGTCERSVITSVAAESAVTAGGLNASKR